MSLPYSLVETGNVSNITVFVGGEVYTADNTHENWDAIVLATRAGDESVVDLFSVEKVVTDLFQRLSERVNVANGRIYFDGEEVHSTLADQVMRFLKDGEDFAPLVKFWEKVATNPNEHSREQLFVWLKSENFTITDEGDILGYRYLRDDFTSMHAGPGIVNGVPTHGHLDNSVGNVVEMARSEVAHDPNSACASGLHVGNWGYSGGQNVVVEVVVNPRDVVSVPTDAGGSKMRVCRYTVTKVASGKVQSAVVRSGAVDTRENHKAQTRDSRGRFLPRV